VQQQRLLQLQLFLIQARLLLLVVVVLVTLLQEIVPLEFQQVVVLV
jgi:hypothetical protein